MKKLMMAGVGMAAAAAAAVIGTGGANVLQGDELAKAPKPKRKVKRRQVAKANRLLNSYSRSKYTPGGENINCGERGISPKSYERVLAATKRRKGVKNPKMKES